MRTILLIEDDMSLRLSLGKMLEDEGFRVQTAANGTSALPLIDRSVFDVVLTDYQLNDTVDGFDILDKVNRRCPEKGKIVMSGRPDLEERCKAAGAAYVVKPFAIEELLVEIDRVLPKKPVSTARKQYSLVRLCARVGAP